MNFRTKIDVGLTWIGNGLVFATKSEAEESARDWMNDMLARSCRVEETDNPVNCRWFDGKNKKVK